MLRMISAFGAAALAAAALSSSPAIADGLEGLHAKVTLKGKVCFADHNHHGSSSHQPSKSAALEAAIKHWAGFVAWEYGEEWSNIRLAEGRGKSCSESGGKWSCALIARPCRPQ